LVSSSNIQIPDFLEKSGIYTLLIKTDFDNFSTSATDKD
jgi:hypothetical protein